MLINACYVGSTKSMKWLQKKPLLFIIDTSAIIVLTDEQPVRVLGFHAPLNMKSLTSDRCRITVLTSSAFNLIVCFIHHSSAPESTSWSKITK